MLHVLIYTIILNLPNFSSYYIAVFVELFNDIYLSHTHKSQFDYLFFVYFMVHAIRIWRPFWIFPPKMLYFKSD